MSPRHLVAGLAFFFEADSFDVNHWWLKLFLKALQLIFDFLKSIFLLLAAGLRRAVYLDVAVFI